MAGEDDKSGGSSSDGGDQGQKYPEIPTKKTFRESERPDVRTRQEK